MLARAHKGSAPLMIILGVANMNLLRFDIAAQAFSHAVQIEPRNAAAWSNLAIALKEQGRIDEAIRALGRATAADPGFAAAHYNLGNLLKASGKPAEAVEAYRRALAINPGNVQFHINLGLAHYDLADFRKAAEAYHAATRLAPDNAPAFAAMGNALFELGRLDDTLKCYRRALELEPDNALYHYNLGRTLRDLHAFDAAEAAYGKALALDPSLASAHLNLGLLRLLRGKFETGLPEYEWRKTKPDARKDSDLAAQPWLGKEDLAGKSILLHAEQGLGDTLQFLRYVELVRERGALVTLAVQPGLMPLVRRSIAGVEVVSSRDPLPRTQFHTHLLSLPLAFRTELATVPAPAPYLTADPDRVERWRAHLGAHGFRIGICWQGSTLEIDKGRSFPLSCFGGVARIPGVRLISLHKGVGEAQLDDAADLPVETLGPDFDPPGASFEDTAAVMMNCDLVLTSDTAVAHLAGALGRPVWVVLKRLPDWRWLLERNDSPWYPTMRLFRQTVDGLWSGPFAEVETALQNLLATPRRTGAADPE